MIFNQLAVQLFLNPNKMKKQLPIKTILVLGPQSKRNKLINPFIPG